MDTIITLKGGIYKMKILSLMLMSMLLLSVMPMVFAQESFDNPLNPGETSVVDLTDEDISTSVNRGGIISQIGQIYERYVDYLGVKIFKTGQTTLSTDFEVYAVPTGSAMPNFDNIISSIPFETSEDVDVRGTQGIWTSNAVSFDNSEDYQVITEVSPTEAKTLMTFDSSDTVWISDTGTQPGYLIDGEINGVPITFDFTEVVSDSLVDLGTLIISQEDAETFVGPETMVNGDGLRYMDTTAGIVVAFGIFGDGLPNYFSFAIDSDGDGVLEIIGNTIDGFHTSNINDQSLLLVDTSVASNWDIYGVLN